jgi:hypothetical protein
MRTTAPVIVAFISGAAMTVAFFLNEKTPYVGDTSNQLLDWLIIIGGFTLLLGVVSILRVSVQAIQRKKEGWPFKIATILSVLVMSVPALLPSSWSPLFGRFEGSIYDWLFVNLQSPMMATMFATLAFYIASAAFRAFRARTAEATLLLVTATLVMFWRVPIGEAFLNLIPGDLPYFINKFVMNGVNLAVQRGIIIGAALGAAALSLRIILGIERTYMGRG